MNSYYLKIMERKMQSIILNKEQVQIIAAAIRPQIKSYINANREKYELFLQAEREKDIKMEGDTDYVPR